MWLQECDLLRSLPGVKPRLLKLGTATVLGAVLLAPSIWMLSAIPPLWRDLDAYIQVTYPPGIATILQFAPLYCFLARIPLYMGYGIECLTTGASFPTSVFFLHPILSDSGVFLLLLSQHVALCCSAFYLIALTSRLFWVRLMLAVAWAANPLFYTFAHCVGSETLSMILLLLIGAAGLRIVQHPRRVPRKEWLLFGILLWLCILTRHINAALAALIPITFFLLSAYRLVMIPFARSQLLARWQGLRSREALQKAILAVAVGISSIALANASLRGLSYAVQIPYYSRVGFTFLWRLEFLAMLPAETRNQLLEKTAKNTASPEVKKVISLLRDAFAFPETPKPNRNVNAAPLGDKNVIPLLREAYPKGPSWDILAFMQRAQQSLFTLKTELQDKKVNSSTSVSSWWTGRKASLPDILENPSLNLVFNCTARAFLYPPDKIFVSAVASDFKRSQKATIPSAVNYLFLSTTFYYLYPGAMHGCASLFTFRDKSAAQIVAILKEHSYFHHWKGFSYSAFLFFWFTNLSLLLVLAKVRKEKVAAVASYAVALTLVGLFMMLANCFLNEFLARHTLPMWELTIVSASVLFGKTMECLFSPARRRLVTGFDE